MRLSWLVWLGLPAICPALARAGWLDEGGAGDEAAGRGRGPVELAPAALPGNLGAPRSAEPETRFGASLRYREFLTAGEYGGTFNRQLVVTVEAQLALPLGIEAGLDVDAFYYHDRGLGSPEYDDSPPPAMGFGFVVLRGKKVIFANDVLRLTAGVGFLVPAAASEAPEGSLSGTGEFDGRRTRFAADPAAYLAYRPARWISFNVSLPFVLAWDGFPRAGDRGTYVFAPSAGIATLWWDVFGIALDGQAAVRLDVDDAREEGVPVGAQASFGFRWWIVHLLLLEAAGQFAVGDFAGADVLGYGVFFRLAATPDLF